MQKMESFSPAPKWQELCIFYSARKCSIIILTRNISNNLKSLTFSGFLLSDVKLKQKLTILLKNKSNFTPSHFSEKQMTAISHFYSTRKDILGSLTRLVGKDKKIFTRRQNNCLLDEFVQLLEERPILLLLLWNILTHFNIENKCSF